MASLALYWSVMIACYLLASRLRATPTASALSIHC